MAEDLGSIRYRVIADTNDLARAENEFDAMGNSAKKSGKDVDGVTKSMGGMSNAVKVATRAIAAMGVALGAREIIQYADAWQNATNQLKTVQKENENLTATQEKLMRVANESRSGFESTANLYTRLTRSTESLNLSQEETIALTDTINKSFAVSGATAQEASNAITQLSQGLAAGALRGEEFNSVSEQSPILMQAIADSLKMTRGELRAFAADGGITAEIVVTALQQASEGIDESFSKMTATFGQSMEVASNNMLQFVGNAESVKAVTGAAGAAIVALSENLDTAADAAKTLTALIAVRMTPAIGVAFAGALNTARAAMATSVVTTKSYNAALMVMQENVIRTTALQRGFSGVMALLGGPAGVAALAAFGIYKVVDAYIDHNAEAEKARALAFLVKGGFYDLGEEAAAYAEKLDTATESLRQYISAGGALASISARMLQDQAARVEKTAEETVAVNAMTHEYEGFVGPMREVATVTDKATDILDSHIDAWYSNLEAIEKNKQSIAKTIAELEHEQLALQMTTRAQAIFNATTEAYNNGAAPEQIAKIATLTAANYDLAESTTKAGKDAEAAAKRTEENWQRTHEYMTGAFVDLMDNGGNAFDNIAKSFEKMIKRMVAEWAASGLMNMFGIGGGSGGVFSFGGGGGGSGLSGLSSLAGLGGSAARFVGGMFGNSAVAGSANFVGPMAQGVSAGGLGASIGALASNPATWAIAALAFAAKNDFWKDPDDYKRSFAGMLTAPTAGAAGSTFAVDPFASGFRAQGIAHGASQQSAIESINVFRAVDAQMVELVTKLGGTLNLANATLSGTGIDGRAGTAGTFLGMGGKTTEQDIAAMVNQFVGDLSDHVTGIDDELLDSIRSAEKAEDVMRLLSEAVSELAVEQVSALESISNAQVSAVAQMAPMKNVFGADLWAETARQAWQPDAEFRAALNAAGVTNTQWYVDGSHANGLNSVPFDGYRAELHKGERVLTASEANAMDMTGGGAMYELLKKVSLQLSIFQRWDFDGLPPERA